jgi:hypothetical protein
MGFDPNLLPTLMQDQTLIEDLCRYSDNILTERQVRQKWHVADDSIWHAMGTDTEFVERVELERMRRIRSGATKRELAQLAVTKAPAVLDKILSDERASPKHRIDAAKTLDDLAGFAPETQAQEDRVHIVINLGADTRAQGLPSNPADILVVDVPANPKPNPNPIDVTPNNTIDVTPQSHPTIIDQQEPIPPIKRGRGRPPGSKNKPKQLPPPSQENVRGET